MVSEDPERRNNSEYSLDAIHRLAKSGNVNYGSPKVQRDVDNLDYSLEDVCECLQSLSNDNYYESVNYGDHKGWLDVYLCNWPLRSTESSVELYIKLKLNRDCITIVLASFHPEGSL